MLNLTTTYVTPGAHLLRIEEVQVSGRDLDQGATLTLRSMKHFPEGPTPAQAGVVFKISYGVTSPNMEKVVKATGRKGARNGVELNAEVLVGATVFAIVHSAPVPGDGYEVHLLMVGSAYSLDLPRENLFTRQARRQGLLAKAP